MTITTGMLDKCLDRYAAWSEAWDYLVALYPDPDEFRKFMQAQPHRLDGTVDVVAVVKKMKEQS